MPVGGVRLGASCAGIKAGGNLDIAVIAFDANSATAATFTKNRFVAEPVTLARDHMASCRGRTRAWVVNSGNANCGTGKQGLKAARDSCEEVARIIGATPEKVLPFSTGVIMEQIPAGKLIKGIRTAAGSLSDSRWTDAANAIMTTDTRPKGASVRLKARGGNITITGIAKGSGMIHPDMATLLSFVATDASMPASALRGHLREAVADSFNAISVDGDTSTNDAVAIAATGKTGSLSPAEGRRFNGALKDLCADLARQIVEDGEGATCAAKVVVSGLRSEAECKKVADSVACSPLVKTMLHARDPNLGRLLMAIGKAGVDLDPSSITLRINGTLAYKSGGRVRTFTEGAAQRHFESDLIQIEVGLGNRKTKAHVTFTDLSYEYVRINAEYRS